MRGVVFPRDIRRASTLRQIIFQTDILKLAYSSRRGEPSPAAAVEKGQWNDVVATRRVIGSGTM